MVTQTLHSFDSGHSEQIHDAQFDYYGSRLATCSSDRTIKVFQLIGQEQRHQADIVGHEGSVWSVSWAHPKFGSLIASGGFDNRIIVWKEQSEGHWVIAHIQATGGSVNCVDWAPHELGLALACASSDGHGYVLRHVGQGQWSKEQLVDAHAMGCLSIHWAPTMNAPSMNIGAGAQQMQQIKKAIVTGGCDNLVKVWRCDQGPWEVVTVLKGHTGWVRTVAWAPPTPQHKQTIASGGQDGIVYIWREGPGGQWSKTQLHDFKAPVWRVSWAQQGALLSVSDGNNAVTLWKQNEDGTWVKVG